jgi:hypothetical protein
MPSSGTGSSAPRPVRWWTLDQVSEATGYTLERVWSLCRSGALDTRVDRDSVLRLTSRVVGRGTTRGRRIDRKAGTDH